MGGSGKSGGADATGGSGLYGSGSSSANNDFYSNSGESLYNVGFFNNSPFNSAGPENPNGNPGITTTGPINGGYGTDGSGAGGSSGFNLSSLGPLFGQIISAYGAYKSTAANAGRAAAGPVLPKDVVAPRQALSDAFLKMILTPGGLDYGQAPFALNIGEGTDPFAAVNKYRESSQPAFQNELTSALDTERAKLGGQYGIRFGTDLQRGLGDTVSQATAGREATLGQLGVSSYDSFMNRRLAELGTKLQDYRSQKFGLLPLIANYLGGQPSSSPFMGGSPSGQALQGLGGGLSNLPLYQYLNSQNSH